MMSDGVVPDGDDWLIELLHTDPPSDDMDALAQLVVDRALCRQSQPDDITALAIRIHARNN